MAHELLEQLPEAARAQVVQLLEDGDDTAPVDPKRALTILQEELTHQVANTASSDAPAPPSAQRRGPTPRTATRIVSSIFISLQNTVERWQTLNLTDAALRSFDRESRSGWITQLQNVTKFLTDLEHRLIEIEGTEPA